MEDIITPDAITINGFAGSEAIIPFLPSPTRQGKGVFVWCGASNATAEAIRILRTPMARRCMRSWPTSWEIADQSKRIGSHGYSSVGMVVGGTTAEETSLLRKRFPKTWFLVPGYGSQGATAADCMRFCNNDGLGALINASRSIIYAYEKPQYREQFGDNWEKCIEQAAIDAKMELARAR